MHADDWLLSHLECFCIYLYMCMDVSLIAASCLLLLPPPPLLLLRRQRKTASIAMMLDGTGYDSDDSGGHGAEDIFDDVCLCSREQQQQLIT